MKPKYIVLCPHPVPEPVKETIRLGRVYTIIPHSNSQAHRIADRHQCLKQPVNNIDEVSHALRKLAELIGDEDYDTVEINDIYWYPTIVEHEEKVYEDDIVTIYYYSTDGGDGYLARTRSGDEINVTAPPL